MSNPDAIATMVMRVVKKPTVFRQVPSIDKSGRRGGDSVPPPARLNLFDYTMAIDYKLEDKDYTMTVDGPQVAIPVYSPEREAEILKEKAGEAK